MADRIIIGVLVLAFVATLAYQLFTPQLARWVWRWDICRVLPSYRLFSAIPRDLRLYYRDRRHNGVLTPWQELRTGLTDRWAASHALWHPQHLTPSVYAALADDVARLTERRSTSPDASSLMKTASYQGLVHAVRHLVHDGTSNATQFKIEEAYGHLSTRPHRLAFVSPFHAL